jgi:hypothetical protein
MSSPTSCVDRSKNNDVREITLNTRLERRFTMSRWLPIALAVIVLLGFAPVTQAGDNTTNKESGSYYGTSGTAEFSFNAATLDFAAHITCVTEGNSISVEVADCCIEGDVWRAIISEGEKLATTSNQDANGVAFPPEVFSSPATIESSVADIYITTSNAIPGGLPAGMTTRISSNTPLLCVVRAQVGSF